MSCESGTYAFRYDGVLCHLHTHNCPFPFIKHALCSTRSGHTWFNKYKESQGQCPVKRSRKWSVTVNTVTTTISFCLPFLNFLFQNISWIIVSNNIITSLFMFIPILFIFSLFNFNILTNAQSMYRRFLYE